jgi:hypothetical protein
MCYALGAMRFPRTAALAACLSLALPLVATVTTDAQASVSIAVVFDALVRESSAVAIVTPVEQRSVWEDGRIYTYTRVRADQAVAGELATGGEAWIRTLGGIVGHIGQVVDGEAVLTMGRPSLLFLRPGTAGTMDVTARAQGQFAVTLDETKAQRLMRSSSVGALMMPKSAQAGAAQAVVTPGANGAAPASATQASPLAQDVLHNKKLDDGVRDITAAWKRLHATR